jgi:hypothetical protein
MRTIEQILSKEPVNTETAASGITGAQDQPQAQAPTDGEKPLEAKPVQAPSIEAKPDKVVTAQAAEAPEGEDEAVPDDLGGLKRALAAARGDKRKARKLNHEIEQRVHETERQLAEYKGREAAYERMRQQSAMAQSRPEPEKPKPVDLTDDDLYQHGSAPIKAYIERRVLEAQADYTSRVQESETRFQRLSKALARQRHSDYDATVNVFLPTADVVQKVLNSDDPAEQLYQYAKTFNELKDVNTIEDYNAKIEAALRTKIEAEMAAKYQPAPSHQAVPKSPIPQSLAGARGNGIGKPAGWAGPRTIKEILNAP